MRKCICGAFDLLASKTFGIAVETDINLPDLAACDLLQDVLVVLRQTMAKNEKSVIALRHLCREALVGMMQVCAVLNFCELLIALALVYEQRKLVCSHCLPRSEEHTSELQSLM